MNKKYLAILSVGAVLGVVIWAGQALAAPLDVSTTPWEASIQAGGVFPVEDNSEAGAELQGRLTYDVMPNVGLGATTGWHSFEFSAESSSGEIDFGDLHAIPVLATAVFRFPLESSENRIVPYLVGGVGAIFWSFNENEGIDADDEATFAAQAGLGIDWFFSDRLALFAEATYLYSDDLDSDVNVGGSPGQIDANVDSVLVGAGIKTRF